MSRQVCHLLAVRIHHGKLSLRKLQCAARWHHLPQGCGIRTECVLQQVSLSSLRKHAATEGSSIVHELLYGEWTSQTLGRTEGSSVSVYQLRPATPPKLPCLSLRYQDAVLFGGANVPWRSQAKPCARSEDK